jgi:hypothetical protein
MSPSAPPNHLEGKPLELLFAQFVADLQDEAGRPTAAARGYLLGDWRSDDDVAPRSALEFFGALTHPNRISDQDVQQYLDGLLESHGPLTAALAGAYLWSTFYLGTLYRYTANPSHWLDREPIKRFTPVDFLAAESDTTTPFAPGSQGSADADEAIAWVVGQAEKAAASGDGVARDVRRCADLVSLGSTDQELIAAGAVAEAFEFVGAPIAAVERIFGQRVARLVVEALLPKVLDARYESAVDRKRYQGALTKLLSDDAVKIVMAMTTCEVYDRCEELASKDKNELSVVSHLMDVNVGFDPGVRTPLSEAYCAAWATVGKVRRTKYPWLD